MKLTMNLNQKIVAALCAAALSPALVFADGTPKPMNEHGIVKSVDLTAHTLVVTEHKKTPDHTFQWNDQTKFAEGEKSVTASALKAGEHVRFIFTTDNSVSTLKSVHISPAQATKPGAKNSSPTTGHAV